jgi:hypothetical protein
MGRQPPPLRHKYRTHRRARLNVNHRIPMMPAVRKKSQILPLANDRFNACAVSAEFLTHPSADIEEASVSTTWMSRSSDSRRTVISYFRYPDPNATKPDSVRNPYRPLGGSHSTCASPKSTLPSQSPTAHPIRPSAASSLVVGHQICPMGHPESR